MCVRVWGWASQNENDEVLKMAHAEVEFVRTLPPHPNIVAFFGADVHAAGDSTDFYILLGA